MADGVDAEGGVNAERDSDNSSSPSSSLQCLALDFASAALRSLVGYTSQTPRSERDSETDGCHVQVWSVCSMQTRPDQINGTQRNASRRRTKRGDGARAMAWLSMVLRRKVSRASRQARRQISLPDSPKVRRILVSATEPWIHPSI